MSKLEREREQKENHEQTRERERDRMRVRREKRSSIRRCGHAADDVCHRSSSLLPSGERRKGESRVGKRQRSRRERGGGVHHCCHSSSPLPQPNGCGGRRRWRYASADALSFILVIVIPVVVNVREPKWESCYYIVYYFSCVGDSKWKSCDNNIYNCDCARYSKWRSCSAAVGHFWVRVVWFGLWFVFGLSCFLMFCFHFAIFLQVFTPWGRAICAQRPQANCWACGASWACVLPRVLGACTFFPRGHCGCGCSGVFFSLGGFEWSFYGVVALSFVQSSIVFGLAFRTKFRVVLCDISKMILKWFPKRFGKKMYKFCKRFWKMISQDFCGFW